ncbi:MAG: hypothetical protein M1456_07365 [Actinobacteria bacterium]|nr:hypothetical protein [Actinomycetota bacterium]
MSSRQSDDASGLSDNVTLFRRYSRYCANGYLADCRSRQQDGTYATYAAYATYAVGVELHPVMRSGVGSRLDIAR